MGYVPVQAVSCLPDIAELCFNGRICSSEDGSQTFQFTKDGFYTLSASDSDIKGTYALERGRLSLTPNNQKTVLYLQFRCSI